MRLAWYWVCGIFTARIIIASHHSSSSCPLEHKQALLQFKNMLTASYLPDELSSWNLSSDGCCSWAHVNCDLQSPLKPVIELHLSYIIRPTHLNISLEVLLPLSYTKPVLP
ncbi:hypothetical protein KSP39_PZI002876 [Platanthera zijinensis]|uniref:Leucine-rich repeat-containing N-terminal plant-type domain-containing protein n=1 Tax=Platanthera zijinensis TaxID=2320716 RepID=A0AAP0C087_9ASPA